MRESGVSILLEYILMFSISTFFLFVFLIFSQGILADVQNDNLEKEMKEIGEEIAREIILLDSFNGNGTFKNKLEIPKEIGGSSYRVYWENGELVVELTRKEVTVRVPLPIEVQGEIYSYGDPQMIKYENGTVVLES